MTKTFKIGEYAVGGIIKVVSGVKKVEIMAITWNKPHSVVKSQFFDRFDTWGMDCFLNELTSSYYADKILTHIKNNA